MRRCRRWPERFGRAPQRAARGSAGRRQKHPRAALPARKPLARRAKDPDARAAPHRGARRRQPHGARCSASRSAARVGFRTRLETRVSRETRIEVVTEGILTRMLQDDSALAGHRLRDLRRVSRTQPECRSGACAVPRESAEPARGPAAARDVGHAGSAAPRAPAGRRPDRCCERPQLRRRDRTTWRAAPEISPGTANRAGRAQRAARARRRHPVLPAGRGGDPPGAARARRVGPRSQCARAARCTANSKARRRMRRFRRAPPGQRKIVLATSIAETSLTIEGIRVVVDSGLRRYAEFDPTTGMSRLVTGKVSQAAADQRRGRAGRLSAGHCYRLWSEGTQASLAPQTAAGNPARGSRAARPRAQLAGAPSMQPVCRGSIRRPRRRSRRRAICCGSSRPSIPPAASRAHGRSLAKLGTHPRLAHMLVKARELRRDAARLRSRGHLERARHLARERRCARRGSASAGGGPARRRARPAAGNHRG